MITIGMPVWNSCEIAWLAMESFCRQKTNQRWELIIFEEKHPEACGMAFFKSYLPRLRKAGCVHFEYITYDTKLPLSVKWAILGRKAHRRSRMFCICDADNYYQRYMIQDSWEAHKKGFDWLTAKSGYFYNCISGVVAAYDLRERPAAKTGLQMSINTRLMRRLPKQEKHRLLNAWIYNNCHPVNTKDEKIHCNTLCTHGYNNISDKRGRLIDEFKMPFYPTTKRLDEIIPADIAEKLKVL